MKPETYIFLWDSVEGEFCFEWEAWIDLGGIAIRRSTWLLTSGGEQSEWLRADGQKPNHSPCLPQNMQPIGSSINIHFHRTFPEFRLSVAIGETGLVKLLGFHKTPFGSGLLLNARASESSTIRVNIKTRGLIKEQFNNRDSGPSSRPSAENPKEALKKG